MSNTDHMLTLEPKIIFGNKWQKARRSARCVDISLICDSWLECFRADVFNARLSTNNPHSPVKMWRRTSAPRNKRPRVEFRKNKKKKKVFYLTYKSNRVKRLR